jgi:hypothetical protein
VAVGGELVVKLEDVRSVKHEARVQG